MPTWTLPRRATASLAVSAIALALFGTVSGVAHADAPPSFVLSDPRITESSGLVASARHDNVYWTHNDSADASLLYAIDGTTGDTLATVTLAGVTARDVEAISLGPAGDLYVGDIGDNLDGGWAEVRIYRIAEPAQLADATVTPVVYRLTYEDGPRDAEALMVHPVTGRVYIASKKRDGDAALYLGPAELSHTEVNTFERVAELTGWVTDGAFSRDGTRLLLRGYFSAQMYRWQDGVPEPLARRVVPPVQQQGESVAFTPDGRALLFGSEGVGSAVEPVTLAGELLPTHAAAEEGMGQQEAGESGDARDAGTPAADEGRTVRVGAVALLGVLVVLLMRRLLFRSRG